MVYYLFYLLKLTKVAIIFKEFEASTKIDLKGIDKLLCLDNFFRYANVKFLLAIKKV